MNEMIIRKILDGSTTVYDWDGTKHHAPDNIKDWMDKNWVFEESTKNCFTVEYIE